MTRLDSTVQRDRGRLPAGLPHLPLLKLTSRVLREGSGSATSVSFPLMPHDSRGSPPRLPRGKMATRSSNWGIMRWFNPMDDEEPTDLLCPIFLMVYKGPGAASTTYFNLTSAILRTYFKNFYDKYCHSINLQ